MNNNRSPLTLLAPAGSWSSLEVALKAGVDAIYFGVAQLNMRARSSINFQLEDIKKIVDRCHLSNARAYLTLNTLLYDHDSNLNQRILEAAAEAKVDAVIAADIMAIQAARSLGLEVHISTQLSVSNLETVSFWAQYADTVVLARELNLKMIAKITAGIKEQNILGPSGKLVKIECFGHGALCIAISGRCGMSLYTDNSSANRGACRQNCRKAYYVTDKESGQQLEIDNEFVMSPSDILTIDFLDQIVAAGISVLKIEGRGRSADYVQTVITCYREAIDAVAAGTYDQSKIADWKERLSQVYNRGFSSGYYLGKQQGWSEAHGNKATRKKQFVGVVKTDSKGQTSFQVEVQAHDIKVGQNFLVIGPNSGVSEGVLKKLNTLAGEDLQTNTTRAQVLVVTVSWNDDQSAAESEVKKGDKFYLID